ncbi:MAG: polysaccharide deacetylase family protein [Oscillochloridaceae bacterium umkhey_bin13]
MRWAQLFEASAAASLNDVARLLERQFPEILWMGDPHRHEVALTFDDGPDPTDTPALLKVLDHHGVTATFSWLGERVRAYPALVRAAAKAGHQLMVHGYRHRSFLVEQQDELRQMLDQTQLLLAAYSGHDPASITSVRPPYGHISRSLVHALTSWGYEPVLCSIMPVHWMLPAELSVRHTVTQTAPGSLIVLHEALGGPPVAELTDAILSQLRERGYTYVTVDALRTSRQASLR